MFVVCLLDQKLTIQNKRRKSTETFGETRTPPLQLNGYTATEITEHGNARQVEYLNRELNKYKECLASMRPKQKHASSVGSTPLKECERKCRVVNMCEEEVEVESFATSTLQRESGVPLDFRSVSGSLGKIDPNDVGIYDEPLSSAVNASMTSKPSSRELAGPVPRSELKFSIQESLSVSRHANDGDSTVTEIMNKEILTPNQAFDGELSLNHHMSIYIRRLDLAESNEIDSDLASNGASEKASIINALFDKQRRESRSLMQKYFMIWVHFNTIAKLTKQNPDQTRLRKMEIFLQNITLERKKTLQKLKAINKVESTRYSPAKPKFTTDSPELLARKFNNK